jgi:putative tributyrin esterase
MRLSKANLLVLLVATVIAGVVAWRFVARRGPSQSAVDRPRLAAGVTMRDITFLSKSLRRNMQYRVFAPQSAGDQKLPVIYLLHGGGGSGFRDWSNYSDVAQFAAHGLLLVMPEGDYSYYTNAVERPQDRYEDYIVNDLATDVERQFPVRDQRNGRAIVGVSMGGFGAIKLALQHPDQFAFAGALSPAIDVPRRRFSWRRLGQSQRFREIFGPDDSLGRNNNDPFVLVRSTEPPRAPYLYITCGQREGLLAPNREFAASLDRYGPAHEFHVVPGGHDWNQWNGQLPALFDSLAAHLGPISSSNTSTTNK